MTQVTDGVGSRADVPSAGSMAEGTREGSPRLTRMVSAGLSVALVGLVLASTVLAMVSRAALSRSGKDIDYVESFHADVSLGPLNGRAPTVGMPTEPSNNLIPYPPGGYLVVGLGGWLAGIGPGDDGRWLARGITLGCSVLAGLVATLFARRLGARWSVATLAGCLLVLGQATLGELNLPVNPRPDILASLLSLLGAYLALGRERPVLAAAPLSWAVVSKHSYLAAPFVVGVKLLVERRWRALLGYAAVGVLVAAVGVALGRWWLGPDFLDGQRFQRFAGAKWKQPFYCIQVALANAPIVFGAALLYPFARPEAGAQRRRCDALFGIVAISLLGNAVLSVKPGASANYMLEPVTFAAPLSAVLIERLLRAADTPARAMLWAFGLVLCVPLCVDQVDVGLDFLRGEFRHREIDAAAVVPALGEVPGPVLSNESDVYRVLGKPYENFPPEMTQTAADLGTMDPEPGRALIEAHHYDAIVISTDEHSQKYHGLPESWMDQIEASYTPDGSAGGLTIYRPRRTHPPHVSAQP